MPVPEIPGPACSACGAARSWGHYCSRCGQRYADVAPVEDYRTAGFGIRALARVIDTASYLVLGAIAGMIAGVSLALANPAMGPEELRSIVGTPSALDYLAGVVAAISYQAISESVGGASLGKIVCGLRVLSKDFGRVGVAGAWIRSVAYLVDSLFFGLVAYIAIDGSKLRQRLGDRWAGTIVAPTNEVPESSRYAPLRVVLGPILGTAAGIAITVVGLLGGRPPAGGPAGLP